MQGSVVKKNNRWYIVYYIGKDINGKWKQKWEGGFSSKKEAEKVLRQRIADLENSFSRKYDNSTLDSYLHYWLDNYCNNKLAYNTVRGYRVNIEKHIIPYIGKIPINRLKPYNIQELYTYLLDSGLSGTTVRYVHNNLHKALDYACKLQIINRNPADYVEIPRIDSPNITVLNQDEVKRLLIASKDSDIYIPILLALSLGLRRGEVLGLQWQDIDFVNRTISIQRSANYYNGEFVLSSTKTKNSMRTLKMSDYLYDTLLSHRDDYLKRLQLFGSNFNELDLVCYRYDGKPITPNSLQHKFNDLLKSAGLPDIRFHDLRHTNATLMLRGNIPAKIVSSMLGHSSIGITMDIYSHVLTDMQEPAVNVINSILENTLENT